MGANRKQSNTVFSVKYKIQPDILYDILLVDKANLLSETKSSIYNRER